jgi:hypothetical protein
MTTATRAARPRPAHNGTDHNGAQDNAHHNRGHDNGATTDAPFARIVTETVVAALTGTTTVATEVATEIIAHTAESAAGTARELMTGGASAVVKKAAGATVDIYQRATTQQLALAVTLADAVHLDWVSQLTRLNADAIAELVTASAGAAHELLD